MPCTCASAQPTSWPSSRKTSNAAKRIEAALAEAPKPQDVSLVVAAMFEAGLCSPNLQPDPNEWIIYAELAVAELRVV